MQKITISRAALTSYLFAAGAGAEILMTDGRRGILQSVTRESGCGTSFLLSVLVGQERVTVLAKIAR